MPTSTSRVAQSPSVQFDALAEEFIERVRAGASPAVTEFAAEHADYAHEIRRDFPTLLAMERVADTASPKQIGEYHIVCELGRGGMGVVYLAEHETLSRKVALKVLPAHLKSDSVALERFRREATAAAGLHHTNIVPVFEVGEADGVSYYSMQFIPGQNLDVVVDEVRQRRSGPSTNWHEGAPNQHQGAGDDATEPHTKASTVVFPGHAKPEHADWKYWRSVAEIGVQVARALEYAHQHGVLHRDIKPSNLLLDSLGSAWVTDFGLAKAEVDSATLTEGVVGTLRFMAPERFDGTTTAASDVYSLGLTLYELATLRPAFPESDRVRLIRQIAESEPVRPRQIAPQLPKDLETIILKASAKEPALRYASADHLADDLQRFVDRQPIAARSAGPAQRAWQWASRNPALATVSAGLLGAVLTGLVSGWSLWLRAEDQAALASTNQSRAEQAVYEFLLEVASNHELRASPRNTQLRENLLAKAEAFYAELQASSPSGRLEIDRARVAFAQGLIHSERSDWKAAQASFSEVLEICEAGSDRPSQRSDCLHLAGEAELQYADTLQQDRQTEKAEHIQRAVAFIEQLVDEEPENAAYLTELGIARQYLAHYHYVTGHYLEARQLGDQALGALERALRLEPDNGKAMDTYSLVCASIALAIERDAPEDPERMARGSDAVDMANRLLKVASTQEGQSRTARSALAYANFVLGYLHMEAGELEASIERTKIADDLYAELLQEYGWVPDFVQTKSNALQHLARANSQLGRHAAAEAVALESIELNQAALSRDPTNADLLFAVATKFRDLGDLYEAVGKLEAADAAWKTALDMVSDLAVQSLHETVPAVRACIMFQRRGSQLHQHGETENAARCQRKAIEFGESALNLLQDRADVDLLIELTGAYINLGISETTLGELQNATEYYDRGRQLAEMVLVRNPQHPDVGNFLNIANHAEARTLDLRAWNAATADEFEPADVRQANEDISRCLELVEEEWVLATTRAAVAVAAGDTEQSVAALQRATELAPQEYVARLQSWERLVQDGQTLRGEEKLARFWF